MIVVNNEKKNDKDILLSGKEKKIQALTEYSRQRSQQTEEAVLRSLTKVGRNYRSGKIKRITIATIAKEAGVTIATIYNHSALLEKIRQTIAMHEESTVCDEAPKAKDTNILESRIKKLVDENKELKRVNTLLLGNLEKKTIENIEQRAKIAALEKYGNVKNIIGS